MCADFFLNPLEQFLLFETNIGFIEILLNIPIDMEEIDIHKFTLLPKFVVVDILKTKYCYYVFNKFFFYIIFFKLHIYYLTLINIQYFKLSILLIFIFFSFSIYTTPIFPQTIWQFILYNSHSFAQQLLKPTFGSHYPFEVRFYNYYPLLYYLFFFIFGNNILGLIPYGFSNSAFIIHNFCLSFFLLSGLTLIGIFIQGFFYYKLFIPKNLPIYLIPFLMIIEIISHFAKTFSLAIRLFANIMSSHILLHILAGFTLTIFNNTTLIGFIPCFLIIIIIFLEFGIAILQAYVFTILLAIYFEETFNLLTLKSNKKLKPVFPLVLELNTFKL